MQDIFLIEYGHDGYQKNPLSVQIPKKSTFLYDTQMHPKQDILNKDGSAFFRALLSGFHTIFACNFY
jgi:hypothetical protein